MRSALPTFVIGTAFAALTMVSGCSSAKAQAMLPDATPLTIPQAPARVVVPPAPDPPPAAIDPVPQASPTTSANPPANGSRTNRETRPPTAPPSNPPVATPPPAPATPATPLETQGNQGELEQRTQGLLASARSTLKKINSQALSADGKAQHDAAERFVTQAESALKAKNIVYAWQLADKANTIATLLLRHS